MIRYIYRKKYLVPSTELDMKEKGYCSTKDNSSINWYNHFEKKFGMFL